MNSILKSSLLWFLAFILTIAAAIYQRRTGPTYELRGNVTIGTEILDYKLIRSYNKQDGAKIRILAPDTSITGEVKLRRFKSYDNWSVESMRRSGDTLIATLPQLPPAGKVMYHITLMKDGKSYLLNHDPAVLRYTGYVPLFILIPHIIFIFLGMMFSTRTGLEAIFKGKRTYLYAWLTLIFVTIGGMILGPVVQKYAFDAYWTGWPFGNDLTDNKTAVAMIFWIIAIIVLHRKRENRIWPVIAAIILLVVFLIPHSMLGSEIDYTQEVPEVRTGQ